MRHAGVADAGVADAGVASEEELRQRLLHTALFMYILVYVCIYVYIVAAARIVSAYCMH
jgi:hypothetical protein